MNMSKTLRAALITLAAVAAVLALTIAAMVAGSAGAQGAAVTPGRPVCGMAQRAVQEASGGVWTLSRANPFGLGARAAARYCVRPGPRPGFTILSSLPDPGGDVLAYPFTGTGCAYGLCSRGTDLPRRVGRLAHATSSWTWRGQPAGYWNASYDLWFDRRDQITTQDDGAELMIWLRTMPGYDGGQTVWVRGAGWMRFMHWTACHDGTCWHYIQFRYPSTVHSVRDLRLWPFITYAIHHHLIRWGWWLTSVHAGYELWSGGKGLATTWFTART